MNQYPYTPKQIIIALSVVFVIAFVAGWFLIPEPKTHDELAYVEDTSYTALFLGLGGLLALGFRQFSPTLRARRKLAKVMKRNAGR